MLGTRMVMSARVVNEQVVAQGTGTNIGDMTGRSGLAAAFDGNTNQSFSACAGKLTSTTTAYIGKNYSPAKAVTRVTIHGSNDLGFQHTGTPNQTWNLRGKNGSAPASPSDGTLLGSINFTESDNESAGRDIESNDKWTRWDYVFVESATIPTNDHLVAELVIYENANA